MYCMEPGTESPTLDRMSIDLLKLLDEYDGSATSSDLRKSLGHDNNRSVNYRKDEYLLPQGLIEVDDVDDDSTGGLPVQRWSLTEQGREALENYTGNDEDPPVIDRVDSLENQVTSLRSGIQDLQRQFDDAVADLEDSIENGGDNDSDGGTPSSSGGSDEMQLRQVRSQLDTLQEDLAGIHQRVQRLEQDGLYNETFRKQLNASIVYAGVAREMLEKEYGEDVFEAALEDKSEDLVFLKTEFRQE